MNAKSTSPRYRSLLIALHWLMLLLIIAVYACIELREQYPRGTEMRAALKTWHFMLGLSVFALVWVRLLVRFTGKIPVVTPPLPRWQKQSAHVIEFLMYFFMLAMPVLGWLALSADNARIPFFGMRLPALIGANPELAKQLEDVHGLIGDTGYFLVGIHAAAALFHHYVRRDDTLKRMLPGR
jgi:cytochrome b561